MADESRIARAAQLVADLGMQPHPEGGYFAEVYRSTDRVQPHDGRAERAALTTIYFLLAAGQVSRWHAVASDEVWHYYEGDPLELWSAGPGFDTVSRRVLGPAGADSKPAVVVRANDWQAARTTGAYTLVGCTVAPGFDFADFHIIDPQSAEAATVLSQHPHVAVFVHGAVK
jgi:uncharacterized protein